MSYSSYAVDEDLKVIGQATWQLGSHSLAMVVGSFLHGGFLQWFATIAAIYLLILDRTNWRTDMQTSLLVPYIFLNLPSMIFGLCRGDVGKWVAFIAVVLHLFFPNRFPGALILLIVAAPHLIANSLRHSIFGVIISLIIGAYLLQQHIRAAGSFRKAFAEKGGVANTIGIILLFVSPLWEFILGF